MAATLDDKARALFDGVNHAVVTTLNADGGPQSSVVWVKTDGDDVLFSTTRERRKAANLERDGRVSILVLEEGNPYSYAEVRGTATLEDDPDGALIADLSQKYTGGEFTEPTPGAHRVIVRIRPAHVVSR
ncbi:PPOX class F420-dependent oxidoreductase [Actinomadura parmotrematis]|uniref:PPOX class F420-dependent oxidoreductase n=1 Tax=Actinomadura parmotrematis TaxID=2864039 RepID=A0ABS7G4I9_9ACTN|nr:PPOX class F420-dependent oxidoreductase [Actinomadura parmotrematis]MBW8487391.1 PPOX class F420-dependent oxidoreductase [Actinomadura parmotrematis]